MLGGRLVAPAFCNNYSQAALVARRAENMVRILEFVTDIHNY